MLTPGQVPLASFRLERMEAAILDTVVGGTMLFFSVIFLIYGVRSVAQGRNLITGKRRPGVYILVGFALLAMGTLVFYSACSGSRCEGRVLRDR